MKRILLIGLACAALAGCGPSPMTNEQIVAENAFCNEHHMDTVMNKASFRDGFYVTCVPAEMDLMTKLEFIQWKIAKRNQADQQAKLYDKPKKTPANPESFETKSKVTQ